VLVETVAQEVRRVAHQKVLHGGRGGIRRRHEDGQVSEQREESLLKNVALFNHQTC